MHRTIQGNFQAKKVPKNEDQMKRIQGRMANAFMFQALEEHDLQIVIGAMEERKFTYSLPRTKGRAKCHQTRR